MSDTPDHPEAGDLGDAIEALRSRFLADVERLRPQLHRYCTRMTGSLLDGEDVVQEALAHAFYRLPTLEDHDALGRWLFRIAHNKCIDFLRVRKPEVLAETDEPEPSYEPSDVAEERQEVSQALELMLGRLPPKERASLLLKDVLGYSLTEVAEIVDSTVGGVKAALHRGRGKLDVLDVEEKRNPEELEHLELLRAYVDYFNAKDWDGLRGLIRADARLELVGYGDFDLGDGYLRNYTRLPWEWELAIGHADGEPMLLHYRRDEGHLRPHAAVRFTLREGQIQVIRDYVHVDYLFEHSRVIQREDQAVPAPSG